MSNFSPKKQSKLPNHDGKINAKRIYIFYVNKWGILFRLI